MALNVTKCPGCQRLTSPRTGECVYCGRALAGAGGPAPAPAAVQPGAEEPRVLGNRAARFRPQADDREHYLVVESREPVSLAPGKLFVLGRDSRTSLTVHASDVSRQHAEIDWQGDPPRPVLCEVRSRNGTYLNERLVTRDAPQPLRNGDRIRLGGSFSLLYLNVPERELRRELLERSQEETRELRTSPSTREAQTELGHAAGPPTQPAVEREPIEAPAAAAARPTRAAPRPPGPRRPMPPEASASASHRRTAALPSGNELESLVAAAMGEAPVTLPLEGELTAVNASELLRQLVERRVSGVLTVSDGAHDGEVVLFHGQCQQAAFGRSSGRAALQQIVRLRRGAYRFQPGEVGRLGDLERAEIGPSLGAPPDPLLEGNLEVLSARDLVRALLQEGRTGALTVLSGGGSAEALFVDGVCEHASLGALVGREALDAICTLQAGSYRFRPAGEGAGRRAPLADLTAGWSDEGWADVNDWAPAGGPLAPMTVTPPTAPMKPPLALPADPWEVDPDDTLMPAQGHAYREALPAQPAAPPPPRSPLQGAAGPVAAPAAPVPLPPALTGPPDPRVPPLRTPRGAPEPWSQTPLRSSSGPIPPGAPAARGAPGAPRRAPPPLPPPRDSERLRRPHPEEP